MINKNNAACKYLLLLCLLITGLQAYALNFDMVTSKTKVTIVYAAYDHKLDSIAAHLLAADIERVTGYLPKVITDVNQAKGNVILIGTIGSKLIKGIKVNASSLQGKWESYLLQVLNHPVKNITQALVITGSDIRGTAYGVFDISERIGVSPWYWWADVKPVKQKTLSLNIDTYHAAPPSVKFRGIFINDEDWGLQPWAAKTFEPETGDIGPKTYAKIFELLLRLKANLIWPAMHPSTKAFYSYPGNKNVAANYEIVIGSSHAEPMLRNNVGEWDEKTMGHFNYITNKQKVYNYWESRVKESSTNNAMYTMGMRGVHDSGMEGVKSPKEAVPLLEQIIADQRGMFQKYINPDATKVPQVFTAYKEVLDVYDSGLKIPDDITLVWPDDNYGYIQRLSNPQEQGRKGGSGIYYHASYWGRPHDYLWLSTTSPALIREEMMKAYELKSTDVWVLNIGDIKPCEYDMQLFLDMAYRAGKFQKGSYLKTHLQQWCAAKWGASKGALIQQILDTYYRLAWERRPEFMGWSQTEPTTATTNTAYNHFAYGDEAQRRIDSYQALQKQAEKLHQDPQLINKDAFYELVYYPVKGASLMNQKFLYQDKAVFYGIQHRMVAQDYEAMSKQAYESIVAETGYYNNQLAGGKWKNIMSMNPRSLPAYKEPSVQTTSLKPGGNWNIAVEGSNDELAALTASLPRFDRWNRQAYFVDIYLTNVNKVNWTSSASAHWIKLSQTIGVLKNQTGQKQQRLQVSIDWKILTQPGMQKGQIIFKGAGKQYVVNIDADNTNQPQLVNYKAFIENNGYVSMFAANYSSKQDKGNLIWQADTTLGYAHRALIATAPQPPKGGAKVNAPAEMSSTPPLGGGGALLGAVASYNFYTFTNSPSPEVIVFTLPTHPLNKSYGMRYAVAIDGGTPQEINFKTEGRSTEWKNNVLSNNAIRKVKMPALKPGKHLLKIFTVDTGVIIDRILINLAANYKPAYSLVPETKIVKP
ncbi:glycosyl hydrolase 115 family protein [Mucilaginibacter terrae]|uniref:glycosyl hydrolase 115 family protein n=1 Tax=Mucilaginibacter terrae TaxID=1955052 RepID=UPI00363C605F